MDILVLIDKLDDLMHNARPVPLTDQVRVDKEEVYSILDDMRAAIPEDIKRARDDAAGAARDSALAEAVSAAIREHIPEIARAVAAETARGARADMPPPGGPF